MKRFLFIGNSFTYVNDLPGMLARLSAGTPQTLETRMLAKGGWYLNRFADPKDEMGRLLRETCLQTPWDGVVLQDQSFNPVADRADLAASASTLAGLFAPETPIWMYQTWAYRAGSEKLAQTGLEYEPMRVRLKDAYEAAAKAVGGNCVPVGDAFGICRAEYPEMNLYNDEDDYHPSLLGTYLAACVFYAFLTHSTPLSLLAPEGIDREEGCAARMIADALWRERK